VVLGQHPQLGQDALAGADVSGSETEGLLALVDSEEPVGIVAEESVSISRSRVPLLDG
jgi:hypothetical protein